MTNHVNGAGEAANGVVRRNGNLLFVDFDRIRGSVPTESAADLKARADIVEIAGRYTDLKRRGVELWGCCPLHGERTPSFKVDPRRQTFYCFGCSKHGDVLSFLQALEGLDFPGAMRRLRELVGGAAADPRAMAERAARMAAMEARAAQDAARRRARALQIWNEAEPLTTASPELPVRYLTERRGITEWQPDMLRWHPACPWGTGRAGCIVAAVTNVDDDITGIWRIKPALEGKIERKGLGATGGGAARLIAGEGPLLIVAEGVEDALAGWLLGQKRCASWAALSAGNMRALDIPPVYTKVGILADADNAGREAAHDLAARLRADGREAQVLLPETGKDANDVLLSRRAGA